jgi:hypothetical protein
MISKSAFLCGAQCLKRLFLHKNHNRLGILRNITEDNETSILESGRSIGLLAQCRFPGGIDCSPESYADFGASLSKTSALIHSDTPVLYEAAFQADDVLCAVDILVRADRGWEGYEVKGTVKTKQQHIVDMALQYWILSKCGINLVSCNILHLNGCYVRRGELNVMELFISENITTQVINAQPYIEKQIAAQRNCLDIESLIPDIPIGPHCHSPYQCDFTDHCWTAAQVPEYSVLNLTQGRGKQWELFRQGFRAIGDIPSSFASSRDQRIQIEAEKSGMPIIEPQEIRKFCESLQYPLYFLDFETIAPATPIFNESRCFQQLCVQYSLHVLHSPPSPVDEGEDGKHHHFEHLAEFNRDIDPRLSLLPRLLSDIGQEGSVIVYYQAFEEARLREMARDFPQYAEELQSVISRLVDLATPFKKKYFYAREMKGKYSIKSVLPALVPEMESAYRTLPIGEGLTATNKTLAAFENKYLGDLEELRNNLLAYCKLDTLGMVRILGKLLQVIPIDRPATNFSYSCDMPTQPSVSPLMTYSPQHVLDASTPPSSAESVKSIGPISSTPRKTKTTRQKKPTLPPPHSQETQSTDSSDDASIDRLVDAIRQVNLTPEKN